IIQLLYNKKIEFKGQINEGYEKPYIALMIKHKDTGWNIGNYRNLKIKIKSPDVNKADLRVGYFQKGFSQKEDYHSIFIKNKMIKIQKKSVTYSYDLNNFKIPAWYIQEKKARNEKILKNTSLLYFIEFRNFILQPLNSDLTLNIEKISINRYNNDFFLKLTVSIIIYYLILFVYLFLNIKTIIKENYNIIYKHLDIDSSGSIELSKINEALNENYTNFELTINDIASETGLTSRKIATLIKEEKGLTFKQYLNKLRINHAKQLIETTDYNLTKIAIFVGYSNSTHFYRIFKEVEGMSPKEYLKKNRR
ncbi:MAG: helix-turn-helix transcriptional regulator, partial [Spirochaetes bacterium]|nr:helix-turn-helix transcriptional regulator [Spirochaetota bacterium]